MITTSEGPDGKRPAFVERIGTIMGHINETHVDLGWLKEYDADLIDGIESFVEYQVIKHETDPATYSTETEEDMVAYAEGTGRSISNICNLLRETKSNDTSDESLFTVLILLAELAYECGAADVYAGRLSSETAARFHEHQQKLEKHRQNMRDLYADLREE